MILCAWCWRAARDDVPLCAAHLEAAARDVAALPGDFAALAYRVAPAGALRQRVSGSAEPSVPLDLLADELRRGIVWQLGVWEPPVREALGLAPEPERVSPARLVKRAASLLSANLSDFCRLPRVWGYPEGLDAGSVARSGLYGVSSLRRVHARARRALDLDDQRPPLCRRCGLSGVDPVECRRCVTGAGLVAYAAMSADRLIHPNG